MADGLHLYKWQNDDPIKLATVSPEMLTKRAGFHELTLVAVGSHLVGYLDGKRTIELMDHSITHEGVVCDSRASVVRQVQGHRGDEPRRR